MVCQWCFLVGDTVSSRALATCIHIANSAMYMCWFLTAKYVLDPEYLNEVLPQYKTHMHMLGFSIADFNKPRNIMWARLLEGKGRSEGLSF